MGIFIYLRIIYNEKWKISGKSLTHIDDLFRDGYTSVFIGTGVEMSLRLGIPGETLGNVHFDLNCLANPNAYRLGENVAVIGMGKDCRSRCGSRKKCRTAHDPLYGANRFYAELSVFFHRRQKVVEFSVCLCYNVSVTAGFVYR